MFMTLLLCGERKENCQIEDQTNHHYETPHTCKPQKTNINIQLSPCVAKVEPNKTWKSQRSYHHHTSQTVVCTGGRVCTDDAASDEPMIMHCTFIGISNNRQYSMAGSFDIHLKGCVFFAKHRRNDLHYDFSILTILTVEGIRSQIISIAFYKTCSRLRQSVNARCPHVTYI